QLIAIVLGEPSNNARTARAAALLENGFRTHAWKTAFPIARIDNYPSDVVGSGFEPDALMLERFRACKAPPPPPPTPAETASATKPKTEAGAAVRKVSAKAAAPKKAQNNKKKPRAHK
ncbi:MAG TPA: hypothetical protein VFF87_04460, partial [Hyphomicrobium sp.]|nr:hypothetical protein [Hyphomicrobium sp.]